MQGTDIVRGRLRQAGACHGAINMIEEVFDDPAVWRFRQFVSEEQMQAYAQENSLVIIMEKQDETDIG